jgi:exopolysaccharide biosynthesis WecB/TagA/CpsF family protein
MESTRNIGAVTCHVADRDQAVRMVIGAIGNGTDCIFAFCNMNTFNLARHSPELTAALDREIVFNDGVGVDVASFLLHGKAFPANLNGTDLTPAVLNALPGPTAVYLLGSPPGIAERAGEELARRFRNVRIVGAHHGFFDDSESGALAVRIRSAGTQLLLLGMGNPRQELWAAGYARHIGATIMCVGAFLDFTAGVVPRAPDWIRAMRCEWAFRLALEPRRMARRYLGGAAPFLWAIVRQRLGDRRAPRRG